MVGGLFGALSLFITPANALHLPKFDPHQVRIDDQRGNVRDIGWAVTRLANRHNWERVLDICDVVVCKEPGVAIWIRKFNGPGHWFVLNRKEKKYDYHFDDYEGRSPGK